MEDAAVFDIPRDIFDLNFREPDQQIPYVDLANTGSRLGLPHIRVVRPLQTGVGRSQDARDGDGLEAAIDAALGPMVLKAWYGLRALGIEADRTKEYLRRALQKIETYDLTPILKDGRTKSIPYFQVPSSADLKSYMTDGCFKFNAEPDEVKKSLVDEILNYVEAIARAKIRLERINSDLYKNQKFKRWRRYKAETEAAIRYRNDAERPRSLVDGLFVSLFAGIDPSGFWQEFSFSRFLYESAIPLGYNLRYIRKEYTGQQIYILYRICNHKFPEAMTLEDGRAYSVIHCQNLARKIINLRHGLENFNKQSEEILEELGIYGTIDLDAWRVDILFRELCGDRTYLLH